MKQTQEVWRDLAGPLYDELVRSKEAALSHLSDTDRNVRIAAIHICQSTWQWPMDSRFVDACRRLAAHDPHDSVREHAVGSLGTALQSSKDGLTSQFLAAIVKDAQNSDDVRIAAYWALRQVQVGITEEDNVRRSAALIKVALRKLPMRMSEEQARQTVLCGGRFPENVWDAADQIDWDFVDQFASRG